MLVSGHNSAVCIAFYNQPAIGVREALKLHEMVQLKALKSVNPAFL